MWNQTIIAIVPTTPTMTSTSQAVRGAGELLSFDRMKRTSHTANTPMA